MEWGNQIGTTFYFVEVIKSGTPRLYASQEGKIVKAPKGSIFKLGENEALLVSSEFPAGFQATPQPVRVCTHPPFPLKHALHSVLSSNITLLHYGSIRLPRLPVTIHYLERLGSFIFGGVMMFGMFWMRHHYLWWKLHPIGSLMMTSYATYCFWGSFFIGWFLKYTTLKFGWMRCPIPQTPSAYFRYCIRRMLHRRHLDHRRVHDRHWISSTTRLI